MRSEYTEVVKRIPLSPDEFAKARRALRLGGLLRARLYQIINDIISDSLEMEDEVWERFWEMTGIPVHERLDQGGEKYSLRLQHAVQELQVMARPGTPAPKTEEAGGTDSED